ncbi:ATP-binding protein [Methanolobus sp. ZRKC3]|uniref:ATP-binding protein n=1 Tax=Methanolobus sp. ZRKC3 TaxID=3125786 RepID=UPI00324E6B14
MEKNSDNVVEIIKELKCANDVFVLLEEPYLRPIVPDEYSNHVAIHRVENICNMFIEPSVLDGYLDSCTFFVLPGWIDNWQENILDYNMCGKDSRSFFSLNYSSILVVDTGFYPDLKSKIEQFSEFTGLPFKVLPVKIDYFVLFIENLILRWNIGKKQNQLKSSNKKVASYAMSLDFVRKMADVPDEAEAVDSICTLFNMMFAPENIVYHSSTDAGVDVCVFNSSGIGEELINSFKHSDASYMVFDPGNSFAIKISARDELLGIVEVCNIAYPENIEEYLGIALDIAKASSLTLSNIRRYEELSRSRKQYADLADMFRTTNRILSHDIANSLQVVTSALDVYVDSEEGHFIDMAMKAAHKSISLIREMQDLDSAYSIDSALSINTVKDFIVNVVDRYGIPFSINGNCLVRIDAAFASVVDNIVSNAIVHGGSHKICVNIKKIDDICRIEFVDDGIGIPDDIKLRVFDEGFKYGETGHTGFGLFIAKKTIERYGGTIHVEDNSPKGTKFIIQLSVATVDSTMK